MKSETEDTHFLPWHSDLEGFKTDFLDSIDAQIQYADWPTTLTLDSRVFDNPYEPEREATGLIASSTANDLTIPMFAPDAKLRITSYFGSS